jgi:hypothetical protein
MRYSMDDDPNLFFKPGPSRKQKLVLELLLVMMRLRLGILVHDLAASSKYRATNMWIKNFEAQWKVFFNYMFCRPYNKMA